MVLVVGSIYALPNLYPTQPSIQVAYTDSARSADQMLLNELEDILKESKSDYEEIFLRENKIVIKFNDVDTQLEEELRKVTKEFKIIGKYGSIDL